MDYLDFGTVYEAGLCKIRQLKVEIHEKDKIFVDTTGGNAIVSMALLQAGMKEDVNVIYTRGKKEKDGVFRVFWDDPESGEIIQVYISSATRQE